MAMARDQDMVKQLQRRLQKWDPDGLCPFDRQQNCEYNELGRLIGLHLCTLELTQVPSDVWQCSALQELDLHNNQLSTLPAEVGQLTALQQLDLNNNRLSTLPAEVGQLTALQVLYLYSNQLSTLPAEVGQLTALQVLSLSNNRLSTLPAEVGQLTALQWLGLHNNPLQTPPPEIVAQGIPAILAYLRTLQQADVERFEAKVILVGEGGMGKTSLLRALQQQPFVEGLPASHGIAVGTLQVPHPSRSQQAITLYTWDFGGQEILQATHQFFLTQRSVYLLLWDARRGAENCRVSFWLDTIKGHAPDAQVLLVATYTDTDLGKTPFLSLVTYQRRYPQIVGLCALSNKTGEGLGLSKRKSPRSPHKRPMSGNAGHAPG